MMSYIFIVIERFQRVYRISGMSTRIIGEARQEVVRIRNEINTYLKNVILKENHRSAGKRKCYN